jgi:itaconate CoA-transferase
MMHYMPDRASPVAGAPLAGVRVIGLEQSVAGPLCTRILGDLGADVIKVEPPGGDFSRTWDDNARGESAQFWWLNRHKRSVELDLRHEGDREALEDLLADADVVVHNMSPRAADRLGLGETALLERHPHLVSCQISGYGSMTTQRNRKAYDMLVQAESGIMSLTGTAERPARTGVSIADVSTGLYGALLVLAALIEREGTGRGRALDVSMLDVASEFAAPMLMAYLNAGVIYPRTLDRHHAIAPYGVFTTADSRRVLLAVHQNDEWRRLCTGVLGSPVLAEDPRYATNLLRLEARDEVDALVSATFGARSFERITAELDEFGLAYAEVNDIAAAAAHPALIERGAIDGIPAASGEMVSSLIGLAERLFDAADNGRREPPPRVGEHTREVLGERSRPKTLDEQP